MARANIMTYRKPRVSYSREIYYILCIIAVIGGTAISIWGPGGYLEMKRTQRELEDHRARVEGLIQSNAQSRQTIQGLRSDRKALEDYARRKGYARSGEIIQQLPPEPAPRGKVPSSPNAQSPAKP